MSKDEIVGFEKKNDKETFEINFLAELVEPELQVYGSCVLPGHAFPDSCPRFVSVDWGHYICVFHSESNTLEFREKLEKQPNVVSLLNSNHFVVGDWSGILTIFEIKKKGKIVNFKKIPRRSGGQEYIWNMLLLEENHLLISGSSLAKISDCVYNPSTELIEFSNYTPDIESVIYDLCSSCLSPSEHIFTICSQFFIHVFSRVTKKRVKKIKSKHHSGEGYGVSSFAKYSSKSNVLEEFIVSGSASNFVEIHNLLTGEFIRSLQFGKMMNGFRCFLKYSDKYFLTGDKKGNFGLIDIELGVYVLLDASRGSGGASDWINNLHWADNAKKDVVMYGCNESCLRVFSFLDKSRQSGLMKEDEEERKSFIFEEFFFEQEGMEKQNNKLGEGFGLKIKLSKTISVFVNCPKSYLV